MPAVSLQYLFGIAIIAGLIVSVGLFSSYINAQVSQDMLRSSLQEISEKVSSEIIDLVSLASLSPDSNSTYKTIDIPDNINNKGYSISIQEDSLGWKVVAYLDEYNTIRTESKLFFKGIDNGIEVIDGTGNFFVQYNSIDIELYYGTSLYSGTCKPVVWCNITQSNIIVGLGKLGVICG